MRSFAPFLTLIFSLFLISNSYSSRPYKPFIEDPLLESWRWTNFPELSGKGVRCLVEDDQSNMWFGVDQGLIKYDGYHWDYFNASSGFVNSTVNVLHLSSDGCLYAGSDAGLYVLEHQNWQAVFRIPAETGVKITSLDHLNDNTLLCGTNKGLIIIRKDRRIVYTSAGDRKSFAEIAENQYEISDEFTVSGHFYISDIMVDEEQKIWLAAGFDNGYSVRIIQAILNHKNVLLRFKLLYREADHIRYYNGAKILKTKEGSVWIITNQYDQGAIYYERGKFSKIFLGKKFGGDEIESSICQTGDGTLWIAGIGKIYTYRENLWRYYTPPQIPLPSSTRLLLYETQSGDLWIAGKQNDVYKLDFTDKKWATYRNLNFEAVSGEGTEWFISIDNHVIARTNDQWLSYGPEDGLIDAPVRVFVTTKNQVWTAGSHQGVAATACLKNNRWIRHSYPKLSWNIDYRAVFEDKNGGLWFGANIDISVEKGHTGGTIYIPDPENNSSHYIHYHSEQKEVGAYGLGQSADGRLWMGGVSACRLAENKWVNVLEPNELRYHTDYLTSSASGVLWVGSRNYGLLRFDGQEWKRYTIEDGMPSNSVTYIFPESDSCLWVATDKGISKFDGSSWTNDLFPAQLTIIREGGSIRKSSDGGIWINKTTREWNRRALSGKQSDKDYRTVYFKPDKRAPKTRIELYEEQVYQPGNTIIAWIGIDPWTNTPTEKLQYSYRIDNSAWSSFSYQTSNIFLSLPDGDHSFEVRARDLDYNIDEKPATVLFNVAPPFYRQPSFYIPMVMLILIIIFLQVRIVRRDHRLRAVKRETDNILENVEEGFLLLDRQFIIGSQYSKILEHLLDEEALAGKNFLTLLSDKVSEVSISTAKDFLELIFDKDHDQAMMDDLNPLSEARLIFSGGKTSRYLAFKFRPIESINGFKKELIVTILDITEQTILEQKLQESQKDAKRQMDWLLSILHVDPPMLQEFIQSAEQELTHIGTWLNTTGDSERHHDLLQNIYRSMHLIKGNASLLNLSMFADQAHRFEDKIGVLQKKPKAKKSDFIILNDELATIKKTLAEVNNLLERIGKIHEQMRPRRSFEQKILLDSFKNLVKQLGQEQEKKIKLKIDHFKIEDIPHSHRIFIKELIVQLLKNAVAHGIEPVEDRIRKHKRHEAKIELKTVSNNGGYIVEVRDDGCGLQLEKIKKRAIELGRWKKNEIEKWDRSRLTDIIFEAGFSTTENADLISGRGVGLDLVKSRVEEKKGRISVEYEEDQYCKFSLMLKSGNSE